MKRRTVKQKVRIYRWDGFSCGVELPEQTLGYIVIERTLKVFKDGNFKHDDTYPIKLFTVDDKLINCLWSEAILYDFFPDFTGYELERVI